MKYIEEKFESHNEWLDGKYQIVYYKDLHKLGLIDKHNNFVLEPIYNDILPSSETCPFVCLTKKKINENGNNIYTIQIINEEIEKEEIIINVNDQIVEIEGFYRGFSRFSTTNNTGLINIKGEVVLNCNLNAFKSFYKSNLTFLKIVDNGNVKWVNITNLDGYQGPLAKSRDNSDGLTMEGYNKAIKAISCYNFGVFKKLDSDINLSKVNYLIGANNSGKSTLIKLIALTTMNLSSSISSNNEFIFSADSETYHDLRNSTFNSLRSYDSDGNIVIHVNIGEIDVSIGVSDNIIEGALILYSQGKLAFLYYANNLMLLDLNEMKTLFCSKMVIPIPNHKNFFLNLVDGFYEEAAKVDFITSENHHAIAEFSLAISDVAYSSQFVKIISAEHDIYNAVIKFMEIYDPTICDTVLGSFVKKWLNVIGIGDSFDFVWNQGDYNHFEYNFDDIWDNDNIWDCILVRKGCKCFRLSSFGRGIRNFCSILIQLITLEFSPYGIDSTSIIVVEEPEQNLHPKLQSMLAVFFHEFMNLLPVTQGDDVQLIIETHSEYLIRKLQTLVKDKVVNREDVSIIYVDNSDPSKRKDRNKQVIQIYCDEDGQLTDDFGPGFFDEAGSLAMDLYK